MHMSIQKPEAPLRGRENRNNFAAKAVYRTYLSLAFLAFIAAYHFAQLSPKQTIALSLPLFLTHTRHTISLSLPFRLRLNWQFGTIIAPFFSSKPLRLFVRLPVRLTIVAECRKGLCYCHNLSNFRGSVLVGGREGRY